MIKKKNITLHNYNVNNEQSALLYRVVAFAFKPKIRDTFNFENTSGKKNISSFSATFFENEEGSGGFFFFFFPRKKKCLIFTQKKGH